ncbi:MAG TPA: twin-arginine translocase subunit TatC [Rariglobus sp.]|jgi:sec-independent protein translocase protein TatC|nr:twin-arginine translocase subunit TatC [Rariglobus sp.]
MAFIDEDDASEHDAASHKSFWAHLDDLRSALVKSAMAVGVGLVLCLFMGDKLVSLLEYPLHRMDMFEKPHATVTFQVGETKLGPYKVTPEQFPGMPDGKAPQVLFHVGTAQVNGQQIVTLTPDPNQAAVGENLRVKLHNFSPTEAFYVAFHVAIYGGLVLSSPFWVYFMGGFILPALNIREKHALSTWLIWGTALFLAGVLLTYFILLPVALRASIEYSQMMGFEAYDWKADDYVGFVTKFIFGMGLGFQFPVIVLLLVKMGILTHHQLARYRRYVIVLCLILGAVLTTPEVITQVCMAVPLYILYEASIWIAWYWDWKRRKAARLAGESED